MIRLRIHLGVIWDSGLLMIWLSAQVIGWWKLLPERVFVIAVVRTVVIISLP